MPRRSSTSRARGGEPASIPRRSQRATPKIQRWVDLLAALLRRHFAVTFDELAREVPAYADPAKGDEARMRMFERDKDELRDFGIPIVSEASSDGSTHGYRLDKRDFYLPYLSLMERGRRTSPRRVNRDGYRALESLEFTPDELAAIGQAAGRTRSLGDPQLAADTASALRKLAFDLPADVVREDDGTHVVAESRAADPAIFETLGDALRRRKRIAFDYHSMQSGRSARREVEGYGLFFLGGHWYLVGRDTGRDALRNFRLSRMSAVEPNARSKQSPDYDVPPDFSLREYARARSPWELGDGGGMEAVVEFRRRSGATVAAARLGAMVEGADPEPADAPWPVRRRFLVRRPEHFARWLLAFGGDAVPVEPPALVEAFRSMAGATLALYGGMSGADGGADDARRAERRAERRDGGH
ncbi:MAG TPA: WYL domain-containing protein, partial [Gemmatimonadaceae bacterium]|nr:WYL domain-containing protein [Gemmatimonadaceae bacterium]